MDRGWQEIGDGKGNVGLPFKNTWRRAGTSGPPSHTSIFRNTKYILH